MATAVKADASKNAKPVERASGEPMPETHAEQPILLRRADIVAAALVGLLLVATIGLLYLAKPFLLPVAMAFVIGTMLSPAATYLERHRVPRAVSAVAIVATACAGLVFMVSLIAAPFLRWAAQLPELVATLREKLQGIDGPLGILRRIGSALGSAFGSETASFEVPKFEWMQSTLQFLPPTLAEFLLFVATLILFIASWGSLRRSLVMTFADHEWRLRTLKILNAIESSLGGYLLTVTIFFPISGRSSCLSCSPRPGWYLIQPSAKDCLRLPPSWR